MIKDITNEVITAIRTALTSSVKVLTENPSTIPTFPCVTVNSTTVDRDDTIDSAGVYHNNFDITFEVYTNTQSKVTDAKSIASTIDGVANGTFGMTRTFMDNVPNYADTNIYRYIIKYTCVIDKNDKIYRR